MRKKDVQIGGRYRAKVSGQMTTVRIVRESHLGGWNAVNEATGRALRIRSAQRLRCTAEAYRALHTQLKLSRVDASNVDPQLANHFWLDRHQRGWGMVELIRPSETEPNLVWVRDLETGDTYPAQRRDLHRKPPRELVKED